LVEQLVRQRAVPLGEREAVVERVLAAMQTAGDDARCHWLFDDSHDEEVAEGELATENGRLVIDHSFGDADGELWIGDDKPARPHAGEALAAFYAREMALHRAQLEGYRAAVAALDTRPIRLALYFPCVPGWCEL